MRIGSTIPKSDGWVWRREWEFPLEGQFSIASKVIEVNKVRYPAVSGWVFKRNRNIFALGSHKKYLCSPELRYCRDCIDFGYHTSLFQLWKFDSCPIHNSPLVSTCQNCGFVTTPFPYDRYNSGKKINFGFRCWNCAFPLGRRGAGLSQKRWRCPDNIEKIVEAYKGIQRLSKKYDISLHDESEWGPTDPSKELGLEHHRIRGRILFDILEQRNRCNQSQMQICTISGAPNTVFSGLQGTGDNLNIERIRHFLSLQLPPSEYLGFFANLSTGAIFPTSSVVPLEIHICSLWRTQFPEDYSLENLCIDSSQGWHLKRLTLSQAGLFAAARIAHCWREELKRLEGSSDSPEQAARLLATEDKWSRRLGNWRGQQYTPELKVVLSPTKTFAICFIVV